MRYAVVSDIHSNLEALTAVLQVIDAQRVDRLICLGDIVGYYANPNEVIDILKWRSAEAIAGNHDLAAAGLYDMPWCGVAGRRATAWTRTVLAPDHRQFLTALPLLKIVDGKFLIVHGALHPYPNETVYLKKDNITAIEENFRAFIDHPSRIRIGFFGHTHHAILHYYLEGQVQSIPPEERVMLSPVGHYLINPGSVGQSRSADPRASFLIYDTEQAVIAFHLVDYNRSACLKKADKAGLLYKEPSFLYAFAVNVLNRVGLKEPIKKMLQRLGSPHISNKTDAK